VEEGQGLYRGADPVGGDGLFELRRFHTGEALHRRERTELLALGPCFRPLGQGGQFPDGPGGGGRHAPALRSGVRQKGHLGGRFQDGQGKAQGQRDQERALPQDAQGVPRQVQVRLRADR